MKMDEKKRGRFARPDPKVGTQSPIQMKANIRRKFLSIAVLFFSACQGLPLKEIRVKTPISNYESINTPSDTLRCLTEDRSFAELTNERISIITFPDGNLTEITIGAIQMGEFKNYYLISLKTRPNKSTSIELRRADHDYFPLNQDDLLSAIRNCAPTK